jgi:hypothetical protein
VGGSGRRYGHGSVGRPCRRVASGRGSARPVTRGATDGRADGGQGAGLIAGEARLDLPELLESARTALAGRLDDLAGASDRLDALEREARDLDGRAPRTESPPVPSPLELAGALRARQRDLALAAHAAGDLEAAERASLRWLGLAPPQRPSGDVERPLAADERYAVLARELVAARARAITAGAVVAPPPCCIATTRRAAVDRSGFAAIALPADRTDGSDDAWLLSPLDPSLGFVPCGYGCVAAQQGRRAALARADLGALRRLLAARLLRLAPGVDLLLVGEPGRSAGALRLERLFGVYASALPPPIQRLVEALVVRRLLAGAEVRFLDGDPAIDARQGLVYVKMLHRTQARWLDLT